MSNQKSMWIWGIKENVTSGLMKMSKSADSFTQKTKIAERKGNTLFSKMGGKVKGFAAQNSAALSAVSSFAPAALSGLSALANPYTALAAGALAAASGLKVATEKAADFNNKFRELANLNLDKSNKQIGTLKANVLDTAFDVGTSAEVMSQAFFDVQSITGKYGQEVEQVTGKVAKFAKVMKADVNEQVTSTASAMVNFKFGAQEVDKFLASSFKTVQVGKVSFEELARVQTDFAASATKSFQSYDSANKLFAVFTTKAKSAEEAATLTKSAFQDLFKASTLKTFKKELDINLFDPVTGAPKQIDQVVTEMNAKFQKLGEGSPAKLNKLVNKFKGNEGLIKLIGSAAFGGDEMLRTFNSFDKTKFSLEKATGNVRNDLRAIQGSIKNRLNILMIKLGDKILPTVAGGFRIIDKLIQKGTTFLGKMTAEGSHFAKSMQFARNMVYTLSTPFRITFNLISSMVGKAQDLMRTLGANDAVSATLGLFDKMTTKMLDISTAIAQSAEALTLAFKGDFKGAKSKFKEAKDTAFGVTRRRKELKDKFLKLFGLRPDTTGNAAPATPTGSNISNTNSSLDSSISRAEGRARQRNVTVTIGKLVENINITVAQMREGAEAIERIVEQALIKAVRDSEIMLTTE